MSPVCSRYLRGSLTFLVLFGCARTEDSPSNTQIRDSVKSVASSTTTSTDARIEPELKPAMARALDSYAPGFQRFAASEYAPRVDTTYRADGDFNGDSIPDVALYGHDKNRELLVVLLSAPDSSYRVVPIEDRKLEPFQSGVYIYMNTEPPGPLEIPPEFKKRSSQGRQKGYHTLRSTCCTATRQACCTIGMGRNLSK
jgi:hypothetical protein